jgi:Zn-dependent metalloprotease
MSRRLFPSLLALAALASPFPATAEAAEPQRVAAAAAAETRAWAARIEGLVREGGLALRTVRDDTLLPDRQHARYEQRYKGVPVVGGDLAVQVSGADVVSVFGTLYDGIDVDAVPTLSADRAVEIISRLSGQTLGNPAELVILPRDEGGFVLVYTLPVFTGGDRIVYSIDAHTGAVVEARSEIQSQSAVGHGRGVLGDDKKMSVRAAGGQFLGDDLLRPPLLETFDLQGNLDRTLQFLNGVVRTGDSDLIADSDNDWTDGPAVDAHTYAGYVYDYYFKRFGRRGLDGNNLRVRAVVHPVRLADYTRYGPDVVGLFFVNAFYAGNGTMVFGEGLPAGVFLDGQNFKPFSAALDVVAHELTHGVTQFTSRLRGVGEAGALNESFSDMMGTSAEFFFQAAGNGPLKADYQLGEDITTPGAVRSMDNPALYGHPDHYSTRYQGPLDSGGIHRNCAISNQVYYLAIEGGTNRTSRLSVQGVGAGNREQIEKVMYRAFTSMMPSDATFATARVVTIQSARDLYGVGSPAERAMIQAWTAVGVP